MVPKYGVIDWSTKIQFLHQAESGLQHLHACGVIHCTVSSQNFLIFQGETDKCTIVKVGDFSMSIRQEEEEWTDEMSLRPSGRVEIYCAPELYERKPPSLMSDTYSFGVVMCEVAAQ